MATNKRKDLLKEGTGLPCAAFFVSLFTTIAIWILLPGILQRVLSSFSELAPVANYLNLILTNTAIVLLVVINALVFSRRVPFKEKVGFAISEKYTLEALFFWGFVYLAIVFGIAYGVSMLFQWIGINISLQSSVNTAIKTDSVKELVIIGVSAVVFSPIAEEYAFRHVIYRCFRWKLLRWESAVLVSLLFALAHMNMTALRNFCQLQSSDNAAFLQMLGDINLAQMIPIFFLGFFLQRIYEKSHSVLPCIAVHAVFNLINFGFVLLARTGGASPVL